MAVEGSVQYVPVQREPILGMSSQFLEFKVVVSAVEQSGFIS